MLFTETLHTKANDVPGPEHDLPIQRWLWINSRPDLDLITTIRVKFGSSLIPALLCLHPSPFGERLLLSEELNTT